MSKLLFDETTNVRIEYPAIPSSKIKDILKHIDWVEDELHGDFGGLTLFGDFSGHLEDKTISLSFDNLIDLKNKLLTFEVEIETWKEDELSVCIQNFTGHTVCDIEEKMIDEGEWVFSGNWLIDDGHMKNKGDLKGLLSLLVKNKILPKGSSLKIKE